MDEIRELLKHPENCFIDGQHPAMEDPEHWCVGPVIRTRDSSLMEESNADALDKALHEHPEWEEDWETHTFNHWAVGWVEHLSFRVLDAESKPTAVYEFLKEWFDALEDYPLADEEDLSQREYDAALDNIGFEGRRHLREGVEDGWEDRVYQWLAQHRPGEVEDRDGNGPYPSEESVEEALKALDLAEKEEE